MSYLWSREHQLESTSCRVVRCIDRHWVWSPFPASCEEWVGHPVSPVAGSLQSSLFHRPTWNSGSRIGIEISSACSCQDFNPLRWSWIHNSTLVRRALIGADLLDQIFNCIKCPMNASVVIRKMQRFVESAVLGLCFSIVSCGWNLIQVRNGLEVVSP